MTEYVRDAPPAGAGPSRYPRASPWVGWIGFAGVLMVILGAVHAFQGLVGIFKDEYFLVSSNGLALKLDFTAWGWVHLIVGVIILVAGLCVMAGQMWARIVGVIAGGGEPARERGVPGGVPAVVPDHDRDGHRDHHGAHGARVRDQAWRVTSRCP